MSVDLKVQIDSINDFIEKFNENPVIVNLKIFPYLYEMINYLENKQDKSGNEYLVLAYFYYINKYTHKFIENVELSIKMGNENAIGMKKAYQYDSNPDKKYTDLEISKIKDEFNEIKDKIKSDLAKNDLAYFYSKIGLIKEAFEMRLKIEDKSKCSNYHWHLYKSYFDLEMNEMALYQLIESIKVDYLPKNKTSDINTCIDNLSMLIQKDNNLIKLLNIGPDRLIISRVSSTLSFMMNNYTIEIIVEYMS